MRGLTWYRRLQQLASARPALALCILLLLAFFLPLERVMAAGIDDPANVSMGVCYAGTVSDRED